jgi:hypothetical protein
MKLNWTWALASLVSGWLGLATIAAAQTQASYYLSDSTPAVPSAAAKVVSDSAELSIAGCDSACDTVCGCDNGCDECCGRGGFLTDFLPCRRCPDAVAWTLFPQDNCRGIKAYGWVAQGATTNPFNPVNPPLGNGNLPVTFNYRSDEYQLNQAYGVIERETDGSCGIDFGGRVDVLYGEDYFFTMAAGLETHPDASPHWNSATGNGIGGLGRLGIAMPQAYAEAALGNFKLKVGHFYTIIGYESVMAPSNFFYSHAYTMQYGEPFTHTGGLVTWTPNDRWTFVGGVVNGWDKFDAVSDRMSVIGGVTFTPFHERWTIALSGISGDEDGVAPPFLGNRSMYSFVFNWNVTERINYVFQHDLGIQQNGGALPCQDAEWYGINQYLFYTINDCWKAGIRAEWFRDDDGFRVLGGFNPAAREGDWYEVALGLNWTPHPNITLRPEARYDWIQSPFAGGGAGGPFDNTPVGPGRVTQFTAGADLIITF